jgi:hypothetical protein
MDWYIIPASLFLNFIPALINICCVNFFFFFNFLKVYPFFALKKYAGTSKCPFRTILLSFLKGKKVGLCDHYPVCVSVPYHILNQLVYLYEIQLVSHAIDDALDAISFNFVAYYYIRWSRGSSVSIESGYGLYDRAIEVRSPAGAMDFSSSLCVQTGSGAHPASCTMGSGGPFPGGKSRPGRDADHSPPSSAEVVNK